MDGLADGAVVLIGGFEGLGVPEALLKALLDRGTRDLTCICQGTWTSRPEIQGVSLDQLASAGQVSKLIAPLPFLLGDSFNDPGQSGVEALWKSGSLGIEAVPQGVLAERLRAGGAGLGGVFLPASAGGLVQDGRENREVLLSRIACRFRPFESGRGRPGGESGVPGRPEKLESGDGHGGHRIRR